MAARNPAHGHASISVSRLILVTLKTFPTVLIYLNLPVPYHLLQIAQLRTSLKNVMFVRHVMNARYFHTVVLSFSVVLSSTRKLNEIFRIDFMFSFKKEKLKFFLPTP